MKSTPETNVAIYQDVKAAIDTIVAKHLGTDIGDDDWRQVQSTLYTVIATRSETQCMEDHSHQMTYISELAGDIAEAVYNFDVKFQKALKKSRRHNQN